MNGKWNRRLITVLALLLPGLSLLSPAQAESGNYSVVVTQSTFTILVGKAGALSAFGHEHVIAVKSYSGRIRVSADDLSKATFELEVETKSLTVADKGI